MRRGFSAVALLALCLCLSGCSGPSYMWIVNATEQNIVIAFASTDPGDFNSANGSPWFWPWRTDPVVAPRQAQKLTAYCYGCRAAWRLTVRLGSSRCGLEFKIPGAPEEYPMPEDWRVFAAYRDDTVQLGADYQLYRIPAFSGGIADVTLIPQPEGYPVRPTPEAGCDGDAKDKSR